MKPRVFAIIAGIALVLTGVVLAFVGNSVKATSVNPFNTSIKTIVTADCGGVWGEMPFNPDLGINQTALVNTCDRAISSRAPWVYVLIGLGALTTVGSVVVRPTGVKAPDSRTAATA